MNLLALETSTEVGSVALFRDGQIRGETLLRAPMNLLTWLSPAIRQILRDASLEARDLDAVAAGIGPGSFTGVRLELATAKTLAQARGLPLYGIASLDALAFQVLPFDGMILACIDARRGELYAGIYKARGNALEQQGGYLCLPPERLVREAARYRGPWCLAGEMNPYQAEMLGGLEDARPHAGVVRAYAVGCLAYERRNLISGDLHAVKPLYIRASNAEIERKMRNAKP